MTFPSVIAALALGSASAFTPIRSASPRILRKTAVNMGTGLLGANTGTAALDPAMVQKYSSIPQVGSAARWATLAAAARRSHPVAITL